MEKKLSVKGFQSYVSEHKPSEISFWSENQEWYTAADPFKIKMIFSNIFVGICPNVIYLNDKSNKEILFDRVKYVCVDEDSTVLGTIFRIHCDKNIKKFKKNTEIIYTLMAM